MSNELQKVEAIFRTLSITLSAGCGRRSLGHLTPTSHWAKESAGRGERERGGRPIPHSSRRAKGWNNGRANFRTVEEFDSDTYDNGSYLRDLSGR